MFCRMPVSLAGVRGVLAAVTSRACLARACPGEAAGGAPALAAALADLRAQPVGAASLCSGRRPRAFGSRQQGRPSSGKDTAHGEARGEAGRPVRSAPAATQAFWEACLPWGRQLLQEGAAGDPGPWTRHPEPLGSCPHLQEAMSSAFPDPPGPNGRGPSPPPPEQAKTPASPRPSAHAGPLAYPASLGWCGTRECFSGMNGDEQGAPRSCLWMLMPGVQCRLAARREDPEENH